jgi:hypothetical protein
MIHFVRSGGPVPSAHLTDLIAHFDARGLEYDTLAGMYTFEARAGDAYVTCDMSLDKTLSPVRDSVFEVQLSHNLTGLKGSPFGQSRADLNILPGRQSVEAQGVVSDDHRFVIGGYAKWDRIYPERFRTQHRRRDISRALDIEPEKLWVCFFPTGPNRYFRGNAARAWPIHHRLHSELPGGHHLFFLDHAHNDQEHDTRDAVAGLRDLAATDPALTVVDGAQALEFITACDLFITDIASALLTALSMDKPVLFIDIDVKRGRRQAVEHFQCGPRLEEVGRVGDYVAGYTPSEKLRSLFHRCVEFDDDQNCRRIADLILNGYARWLNGR